MPGIPGHGVVVEASALSICDVDPCDAPQQVSRINKQTTHRMALDFFINRSNMLHQPHEAEIWVSGERVDEEEVRGLDR